MKHLTLSLAMAALVCVGCKTSSPLLTPAAVQTYVAVGAQAGMQFYPQAVPGLKVGREVICAEAAGGVVDPNKIVTDLSNANITNAEAKVILNASILLFQQIVNALGTNNQAKLQPYEQAICNGLTEALGPAAAKRHAVYLRP